MPLILAAVADLVFVAVHLVVSRLALLSVIPRSRWLSVAGGVSVAYVFLQLLPELADAQERVRASGWLAGLESHVYVVALLGLATFYGLERFTTRSRASRDEGGDARGESRTTSFGFAVSIGSFALYNAVIGYVLLRDRARDPRELAFYTAAMGLHFLVNDWGLRDHHQERYDRIGRWILAASVTAGVVLGATIRLPEPLVIVSIAFLAGGVVLNVLKEELPEERQSSFSAFLVGVAAYAALALLT